MILAIKDLKKYRTKLTRQQLMTIRGQIKSGEQKAAQKGLRELLARKESVK